MPPPTQWRVVIDTNILIGSFYPGASQRIIKHWRDKHYRAIVSREVLAEYQLIMRKFPLFPTRKTALLEDFENPQLTECVQMGQCQRWVKEDPEDDKLIATGLAGNADALISNDDRVLAVGYVEQLLIISPGQFLKRFPLSRA